MDEGSGSLFLLRENKRFRKVLTPVHMYCVYIYIYIGTYMYVYVCVCVSGGLTVDVHMTYINCIIESYVDICIDVFSR